MDVLRDIKNPYCVLLEDIKKLMAGLTEQQIKDAVESFREQIQSNRVASYIKDISGLISILEARNVLHSKNVDALLLISKTVNHPLAIKMVENYKRYKEPTVRSLPSKMPARSPMLSPQEQQRENVFLEVAKLLGKDVRPFARALNFGLNENELNNIVLHSQDENLAALQILKLFREKTPTADHISRVMKALSTSGVRRADIVRKINSIVSPS